MSYIVVPQLGNEHLQIELKESNSFINKLLDFVNKNILNAENCTFFVDAEELNCIKFTSNIGKQPNYVFQKLYGPVIFYKKDKFNQTEQNYMLHMLNKVKGKQIV